MMMMVGSGDGEGREEGRKRRREEEGGEEGEVEDDVKDDSDDNASEFGLRLPTSPHPRFLSSSSLHTNIGLRSSKSHPPRSAHTSVSSCCTSS